MDRSPDDTPPLQTISTFSRAVGLSPSALRLYADKGLVTPAEVDERTGYRYYTPTQQRRAIWVRRLREAGLSLATIGTLLDGSAEDANAIIDAWLGDTRHRTAQIETLTEDLRHSLRAEREAPPRSRTEARLDGEHLAMALTQVERASAPPGDPSGLDGVLVEIFADRVAVVATDRHLMLARTALPADIEGPPARVQVSTPLTTALAWLAERVTVSVVVESTDRWDRSHARLRAELHDGADAHLPLSLAADRFPSCAQVLAADEPGRTRLVLPLEDVRRATVAARAPVTLAAADGTARLAADGAEVTGRQIGQDGELEVSPGALRRIAAAAVGDTLVCDVRAGDQPLLWSAPGQPDFAAASMALR